MTNPFYVEPVNPLAALMSGQQGYDTAKKRADADLLSSIGDQIGTGNLDYNKAAATAAHAGKLDVALALLKSGEEKKASQDFSSFFTGGRGGGGSALGTLMAPQGAPSIGRSASPATMPQPSGPPPQQATEGMLSAVTEDGRDIAPEVNAAGAATPVRQTQAAPSLTQNPAGGNIPALMAAVSNPRLGEGPRAAAKVMLEHALKSGDLPPDQKDYALYRQQNGTDDFTTWLRKNKTAGATAITNVMHGENAFESEMGKKQADRWNGYIIGGDTAGKSLVDIQNMREISRRLGSQGAAAGIKEAIGPYAEALGINIDGLSDIQAYSSIIQRLAPQQRAPGSGSTSNIEFRGFLRSLPGLSQNPQAREVTLDTMEALARHQQAEAEIASRLASKEITRGQAEVELRKLPDPMAGFAAWRKANPDVFGPALKGAATSETAQSPVSGARKAPDGNWYVPDPKRPGKYLMIQQ